MNLVRVGYFNHYFYYFDVERITNIFRNKIEDKLMCNAKITENVQVVMILYGAKSATLQTETVRPKTIKFK